MSSRFISVALLIETSTSWGAGLVRGVARYSQEHGPWQFFIEPRGRYERLTLPPNWHGSGIIARINHAKLANHIRSAGIPCINVSWFDCGDGIPRVSTDEVYAGRVCAEHFVDRGFARFAYCGPFDRPGYTDKIKEGFVGELVRQGFPCSIFASDRRSANRWSTRRAALAAWLQQLAKPIALLTWNDVAGRLITEVCTSESIRVPEEIAILTGEEDTLSNALSDPPLSTVDHSPELVGYTAAQTLHLMMGGGAAPTQPVLLRNQRIVPRQSSDVMAINDKNLASAIAYMRGNAHRGIAIRDVLRHASMSRRTLEIGCKEVLGRSPGEELRRQRISHAKRLLLGTRLPIAKVAGLSGFRDVNVFGRRFRQEVGCTATDFRKRGEPEERVG